MKKWTLYILVQAVCLLPWKSFGQQGDTVSKVFDTLACWTFPTGTSIDTLATKAIPVNIHSSFHVRGASTALNLTHTGFSSYCAQAYGWNAGPGSKYWIIDFATPGYFEVFVYSRQEADGDYPGPRDFKIQNKSENAWSDVDSSDIKCATNWTTGQTKARKLNDSMTKQSNPVFVRWITTSDTDYKGSLLNASGISRIDDIYVIGMTIVGKIYKPEVNRSLFIYPNPCHNQLTVLSSLGIEGITVFDSRGKIVFDQKVNIHIPCEYRVNLNKLLGGVYFMSVIVKGYKVSKRIIII